MTEEEKSKPVHKIRAGTLELAIWTNDGEALLPLTVLNWRQRPSPRIRLDFGFRRRIR